MKPHSATERRLQALKIAASMIRPRGKEGTNPTAQVLIDYAEELADYMYNGPKNANN